MIQIFAAAAASESCIILYEEATVKEHDFARFWNDTHPDIIHFDPPICGTYLG